MFSFWKRAQPAPAAPPPSAPAPPPKFEVRAHIATDVGCVRELNEDSVRIARPDDALREKGVLIIVADGMGGHAAGEVASQKTVEEVPTRYFASDEAPDVALKNAVEAANAAIFGAAARDKSLHGMGTTCTCLLIRDDLAWCAHVGDSRLYLVRGGAIYQMSEDHSAVGELVKRGLLAASQMRGHPQSNIILRALGTQPSVEVALWDEPFPLRAGDVWVLCSDGLSDLVVESEILSDVTEHDAETASQSLIERAKAGGGHDNISVALVEIAEIGAQLSQQKAVETREVEAPAAESAVVTREASTLSSGESAPTAHK